MAFSSCFSTRMSSLDAKRALEKVECLVDCPICLQTLTSPKLLPCLHIYCKECLVQTIRTEHGVDILRCSICRNVTRVPSGGISEFEVPFFVSNFIDGYKSIKKALETCTVKCDECDELVAVGYCKDCDKYLCEGLCTQVHQKWKKYTGHVVISVEERQASLANPRFKSKQEFESCQIHSGELAKMFCELCEVVVCRDCIFSRHRDHQERCHLVVDVAATHKGVVQSRMHSLSQQLQTVSIALSAVDAQLVGISDQNRQMKQKISTSFGEIMATLEARKTGLLSQVDVVVSERVKMLEEQKEALEISYAQMKSCIDFANETLDIGTDADILGIKRAIIQRADETSTSKINAFDFLSTEDSSTNLFFSGDNASLVRECECFGLIRLHAVCPSKCQCSHEFPLKAVAGEVSELTVCTVNSDGAECVDPVDDITCEVVFLSQYGENISRGTFVRLSNEYKLSYQPVHCGRNYVHIKINGEHILGSPFPLFVFRPIPVRIIRDLQHPWGVALTSADEIVVVESGDISTVSVVGLDGKKAITFGGKGCAPGKLSYPRGVALDERNFIFVADYDNHRIQKFASNGEFLQCAGCEGSSPLQFKFPFDLAVNCTTKRIYVADQKNHRIQILDSSLKFCKAFGSEGQAPGQLSYPCGIAVALDGRVYVTDSGNSRVQVFSPEGEYMRHFSEKGSADRRLSNPVGICINSYTNNVLVSDTNNHCICCFSIDGEFIGEFGEKGESPGQFDFPGGIVANKSGSVCCVADQFNGCIQIF